MIEVSCLSGKGSSGLWVRVYGGQQDQLFLPFCDIYFLWIGGPYSHRLYHETSIKSLPHFQSVE